MNITKILMVSAAAALFAGCADYYGPGYVGVGYGPVADVDYDGYYDGYYGPIYDGYWSDGGVFVYQTRDGGRWRRGDRAHFRHDAAPGYNHVHGTTHARPRQDHRPQ